MASDVTLNPGDIKVTSERVLPIDNLSSIILSKVVSKCIDLN